MALAKGSVEKVFDKEGRYSVKIDDGTKEGMWLGFNKVRPKCSEGDIITVEYSVKGSFKNADPSTLVVAKDESTGKKGSDSKVERDDKKQATIEWQSARNAAIELVKVFAQVDGIKFPAKSADKMDTVMDLVNDLTVRFVEEARTQKLKGDPAEEAPSKSSSKYAEEE